MSGCDDLAGSSQSCKPALHARQRRDWKLEALTDE
jgi:hypothetical protein